MENKTDSKLVPWGWADRSAYLKGLWMRYRLTSDKFELFWLNQQGLCAGCKCAFAHPLHKEMRMGIKPEIDHDHLTMKVRGLLCRRCNDFLGKIKDNRELLQNLIEYLKRSGDWT